MNNARILVLLVLASLARTSVGLAAEPLSLRGAIEKARARNADLDVARSRLREAVASRAKITTVFLPDIRAVGTYTHNSAEALFDSGAMIVGIAKMLGQSVPAASLPPATYIQKKDTVSAIVQVDQTLFAISPILARKSADLGVDAARITIDAVEREVIFRVMEAFYLAAGLERLVAVAERAMAQADLRIKDASARRYIGAESELPILRARVERSRAAQDLAKAKAARKQVLEMLGTLLGEAPPGSLQAPPEVTTLTQSVEALAEQAVNERPDLRARKQMLASAEASVRESELRWLPMLTLGGLWRYSDTKGFSGLNTLWSVNANLVLPIFDRGARYADTRERREVVSRVRAELEKAERDLRNAVRVAANDLGAAREVLELARVQRGAAARTAEIVTGSHAAGAVTNLEVSEADTNLRLSETTEERERINYQLSLLRLRHAAGASLP